jgi:hypothetical protein
MAADADRTATYEITGELGRGSIVAPVPLPVRVRAASGPQLDQEIRALLRQRLLIGSWLILAASSLSLLLRRIFQPSPTIPDTIIDAVGLVVAATSAALSYLLWRRPVLRLRGLRGIELIIVGLVATFYIS